MGGDDMDYVEKLDSVIERMQKSIMGQGTVSTQLIQVFIDAVRLRHGIETEVRFTENEVKDLRQFLQKLTLKRGDGLNE